MHVVIYFSLLGKLDVLKMIFKLKCKDNTNHLLRNDWESLVDIMLSNESVQYSRKAAIAAFDIHASSDVHGTRILFFDDFRNVSVQTKDACLFSKLLCIILCSYSFCHVLIDCQQISLHCRKSISLEYNYILIKKSCDR